MDFREFKQKQAAIWGSAPFENVSAQAGSAYDDLIARVCPQPGERVLDVATGTGAIAVRAARAGAVVTASDFSPVLVETAKKLAAEESLPISFDVADADELPYEDESFDVVTSSFGVMFAPNHQQAAAELARVCRPGGRIGIMSWRPEGSTAALFATLRPFQPPPPEGAGMPVAWGERSHVSGLLEHRFDLEFFDGEMVQTGSSGEEIWELFVTSFGPVKALAENLEPERREELHTAFVDLHERYRDGDGIRRPGEYLIVIGRRRSDDAQPARTAAGNASDAP